MPHADGKRRAKARARQRRTAPSEAKPYHVVPRKLDGAHAGYDLYCHDRPFLRQVREPAEGAPDLRLPPPLKRHQAYAIARLLNESTDALKWAAKFGDPYA
jgi:hypothetical protein